MVTRSADLAAAPDVVGADRMPLLAAVGRLLVVAVAGFAFGFGTNQIPAPDHFGPIWIANVAAPYALLPFAAGAWALRTPWGAVLAGNVMVFAAFAGFYTELLTDTGTSYWALLTGNNPWLVFELFAGTVFGYLGHRWWHRRSLVAVLLCASIPIAEPLVLVTGLDAWVFRSLPFLNLYPAVYPRSAWNLTVWGVEAAIGLALAGLAVRQHRRRC